MREIFLEASNICLPFLAHIGVTLIEWHNVIKSHRLTLIFRLSLKLIGNSIKQFTLSIKKSRRAQILRNEFFFEVVTKKVCKSPIIPRKTLNEHIAPIARKILIIRIATRLRRLGNMVASLGPL
ncbi:hypothetical protein EBL84_16010 [Marichromatium sp. AB31]|nr:hypothetical protein EBL84_16010 [Marichromatium sp. AB31]